MSSNEADLASWRTPGRAPSAEILISRQWLAGSDALSPELGGFELRATMVESDHDVPEAAHRSSQVLILEVRRDSPDSMNRFARLVSGDDNIAVIAAVANPSLDDARTLLRAGARDILGLPLMQAELEASLQRIRREIDSTAARRRPKGKIVTAIKAIGGVGATTLLTQIAIAHAQHEVAHGRETCLIDLDVQFGTAALYLGQLPKLGVQDLIDAGSRADEALLRATMATHPSGLQFVAAPPELIPLESVDQDMVTTLLDLAAQEYATVFVDLPPSWTNWSLAALARSNLILLVTDLSLASLQQARRQIDFIRQQSLGDVSVKLVVNKLEKKLFKSVSFQDAERVLGRRVDFTVTADHATVQSALDQGIPLAATEGKSRATRDIHAMASAIAQIFAGAA